MSDHEFEELDDRKPLKKPKHDVNVILIDTGKNMQDSEFTDAVRSTEWLLTRKIMRQKCDLVQEEKKAAGSTAVPSHEQFAIIAFGTEDTQNHLEIDNVVVSKEVLEKAAFDHMRYLSELQPNPARNGDWLDGLIVAVDFMKNQVEGDESIVKKRVILFTNGNGISVMDDGTLEAVANGIRALDMELHVVGISVPNGKLSSGASSLRQLVGDLRGKIYSYENVGDLISQISAGEKLSRLFGFSLQISTEVKLPLKCISYISKSRSDKEERMRAVDPNTFLGVRRIKKYLTSDAGDQSAQTGTASGGAPPPPITGSRFDADDNFIPGLGEGNVKNGGGLKQELKDDKKVAGYTQVEEKELAWSYLFGTSKVVMSDEDRKNYKLSFNRKQSGGTMELICTTPKEKISVAHLVGDETRIFIPDERKDKGRGLEAVDAFVKGLLRSGCVAVVRFAWNKASEPHMIVLVPKIHEQYGTPMLYSTRLAFEDDIRHTEFPKLEEFDENEDADKLEAIDKLIDVFQGTGNTVDSRRLLNSYLKKNQLIFKKVGLNTIATRDETHKLPEGAEEILREVADKFPIIDYKELKKQKREEKVIPEVDVDALMEDLQDVEEDEEDVKPIKEELDAKIAKSGQNETKGMSLFLKEQFANIIVSAGTDDEVDLAKLKYARSWCIRQKQPKLFNDLMAKLKNLDDVVEWAATVRDPCLRPISNAECLTSFISAQEASDWWNPVEEEEEEETQWDGLNSQASDLAD